MLRDGVLAGRKLAIMDSKLAGRGLFAACKIKKRELITFFGVPPEKSDSYGYKGKRKLPKDDVHTYQLNGFFYDNKHEADLFKVKEGACYVPDKEFGNLIGLGWAANSSRSNISMRNCIERKLLTYPLCQHILCTDMRFAEMEYLILVATRDISVGEEILHKYNLAGYDNRKAKS
jgi:hypothetical protein